MAKAHSAHEASRLNDGYMGVIKVAELLPAVAEVAAGLEIDGVSDPVSTDSGLHIIKRGQTIAAEMLPFDAVKDRVRTRLRRDAALKIRRAAVEKIVEQYPIEAPDADLETWRSQLSNDIVGG